MKILCVIEDIGPGGAQRQLVNLALWLKGKGHHVSFLTYFHKDFYLETLKEAGINYNCLPIKNPIKRIIRFRQFIRSGKYDAVIAFLGIPAFLAEMAGVPRKKWKLIVGERSANPLILTSKKKKIIAFFHIFADWVVSNSRSNLSMVQKVNPFLKKKKCRVIYNAIDLKLFSPAKGFQFKNQKRLKIIVPASYRRLKNLLGLIEAVNLLSDSEKESLYIDWYGDKSFNFQSDFSLSEAKERIKEYKLEAVFHLNGPTKEIHQKIQSADIVGLFSFHEGLPNAICEGMACGKVILSSTVSDIPGFISEGENGFLFNPKNVNEIASALRRIIATEPASLKLMGKKNRIIAENLFENQANFNEYIKLIETGKRER